MKHVVASFIVASVLLGLALPAAHADIAGFGDFSGFSINQRDGASAPTLTPTGINLSTFSPGQSRSLFCNTPQDITQFTATFTYQMTGTPTGLLGACFVVQNTHPDGPATAAYPSISGINTRFGYSDFFGTFNRSVAVSLEAWPEGSASGVYHDGGVGGGASPTAGVLLSSGHPIAVTVGYSGTILSVHMLDTVTGGTFDSMSLINIPGFLSGGSGYVGFTAATHNNSAAGQYISNFTFTAVPVPGTAALLGFGGLLARRCRR